MRRMRRAVLIFLALEALLVMGISLTYQLRPLGKPFGGFVMQWDWRSEAGGYMVHFANSSTWDALRGGQVNIGDHILSVNGRPPAEASAVYAGLPVGAPVTYEVVHRGDHRTVVLPVTTLTFSMLLEAVLPFWMLSVGLWLIGAIVVRARPDDPVNWRFGAAAFLGSTIIALFNSNLAVAEPQPLESLLLILAWAPSGPIMGGLMVQLVALFPVADQRSLLYRTRNLWMALAIVIVLFYELAILMMLRGLDSQWTQGLTYVTENIGLLLVVSALGLAGLRYTSLLRRSPSRKTRHQLIIVSLSCLVGVLIPLVPYVLYRLLGIWPRGLGNNNLPFLTFIFLVGVAYAILRYQLFQARSQVLAFMNGTITSVALAYLTFLVLGAIPGLRANLASLLVATSLTTFLARRDSPSRRRLRRLMSRQLEDYRVVEEFNQVLGLTPDNPELQRHLLTTINRTLELEWSALWNLKDAGHLQLDTAQGEVPDLPAQLELGEAAETRMPVRTGLEDAAARQWRSLLPQAGLIIPLRHREQLIGILALGQRWTEDVFDEDDIRLTQLLGRQVALLLVTRRQLDELRQLQQRLARVQERERERISQELHDSTQQFLGSLPFRLATVQQMLGGEPQAQQALAECQQEIKRAADELRALRRNLSPGPLLERGLRGAIEALAEQHRRRSGLRIEVDIDPSIDRAIAHEQKHLLYRVIQQALDNAAAHARADSIALRMLVDDELIHFRVADDGQGFDPADLGRFASEGHDGLRFMRDRVEALGGWLQIDSTPGGGTTISGTAPRPSPAPQPILAEERVLAV